MAYSLTYDLDGKYSGPMPYKVDNPHEMHVVYSSTGSVQLPVLSEGEHCLTINLIANSRGNGRNWEYHNSIYFTIDRTPPNITFQSPLNTTYSTTDIPLTYTLSEPIANVTCLLDGNKTAIPTNTTLSGLTLGEHSITLSTIDSGDNKAKVKPSNSP